MRVLQVACGSSHTLFMNDLVRETKLSDLDNSDIATQGKVYAVGQGDSGQLGLGPRVRSASVPVYVPLPYDDFNFLFIVTGIAHNGIMFMSDVAISHFKTYFSCSFTHSVREGVHVWVGLIWSAWPWRNKKLV